MPMLVDAAIVSYWLQCNAAARPAFRSPISRRKRCGSGIKRKTGSLAAKVPRGLVVGNIAVRKRLIKTGSMSRYMTDGGGGEYRAASVRIYVDINRRKFRGGIYEWCDAPTRRGATWRVRKTERTNRTARWSSISEKLTGKERSDRPLNWNQRSDQSQRASLCESAPHRF